LKGRKLVCLPDKDAIRFVERTSPEETEIVNSPHTQGIPEFYTTEIPV